MDNTVYTVDYFLVKFENTPEESFFTGDYINRDGSKMCALGMCGRRENMTLSEVSLEAKSLEDLFVEVLHEKTFDVNDGLSDSYQQPTPKQRILAALRDIKAKQQPEVKERIVYVTVDAPVRELQKVELIEN